MLNLHKTAVPNEMDIGLHNEETDLKSGSFDL